MLRRTRGRVLIPPPPRNTGGRMIAPDRCFDPPDVKKNNAASPSGFAGSQTRFHRVLAFVSELFSDPANGRVNAARRSRER